MAAKFRARFRKISTREEIFQYVSLDKSGICSHIETLPKDYVQVTDWEQYIGTPDINGVPIYVGDIIDDDGVPRVVVFNHALLAFSIGTKHGSKIGGPLYYGKTEKVGNIHENKEILECL